MLTQQGAAGIPLRGWVGFRPQHEIGQFEGPLAV
jgi:hypothetical protein